MDGDTTLLTLTKCKYMSIKLNTSTGVAENLRETHRQNKTCSRQYFRRLHVSDDFFGVRVAVRVSVPVRVFSHRF